MVLFVLHHVIKVFYVPFVDGSDICHFVGKMLEGGACSIVLYVYISETSNLVQNLLSLSFCVSTLYISM